MNRRFLVPAAAGFALLSTPLPAQLTYEEFGLTTGPAGSIEVTWNGYPGRTYFLQVSTDLKNWQYAPLIEQGTGIPLNWGATSTATSTFFRLLYTDQPTSDPDNEDFDLDGLGSWDEITLYQTNPLRWDTDSDGIGDGDEVALGTNPKSPNPGGTLADADEDGVSDADELSSGSAAHFPDNPAVGLSAAIANF